jgi:eukaryotic-like serine/threonine-protein kinase
VKSERWQRLDELFHAALECESTARAAFVNAACENDAELRHELESMLAHHEQANSFIESPAYVIVAETIVDDDFGETLIGKTFGQYQIIGVLGKGGMGAVYLAFDSELHRKVALKLLHDDLSSDSQRVQRFKQEARAVSALNHPNILTIHQIGGLDGRQFIATEFVAGETLREIIRHNRVSVAYALDIVTQIGSALTAAHETDIIHRDIKPENVMVRPDGYVKVLDFGLAKLTEPSITNSKVSTLINTEQGTIIGTVQYMSPEQARGLALDARTDIWSLGVVLYEMLAEHPPFDGDTRSDVIAAILEREPLPLTRYNEEAPAALQSIITRALRKDRNARYQTVKDLLVDLRDLKQQLETDPESDRGTLIKSPDPPLSNARKKKPRQTTRGAAVRPTSSAEYIVSEIKQHKTGVAVVLLAVVVAVTAVALWFSRTAGRNTPMAPPQAMTVTRPGISDRVQGAAISPDGKYIAYVVKEPICCFQQSLRLRQVGTASDIQTASPSGLYHQRLVFAPDGKLLYFTDNSDNLYQMPTIGGPKTKLIAGVNSPISFSPDGKRFAFLRDNYPNKDETALMVANADGSGELKIASRKQPDIFGDGLAWSPVRQVIACAVGTFDDRGRYLNLVEVQLEDGGEKLLTPKRWTGVGPMAWLADGSGLLMLADDEASMFSPQVWQVSYPYGDARMITTDLVSSYENLSLTADSTMLLTEQLTQTSNVWIAGGTPSQARQITSGSPGSYDDLSWLSEGHLIYGSNNGGNWDIWRLDVENGTRRQLTINAGANGESSACLDGRYVVFASNRAGPVNIWRMDADGGNPKQLTSGTGEDQHPQCTPDGKWVIYESARSDKGTLFKVPIDGGGPVKLLDKPLSNPVISPDGKWIVYDETTLWKLPIDGGKPVQLFDKPSRGPAISPDGKLIACRYQPDSAKDEWKVAIISFEGGPPIQVFDIPAHPFWHRLGVRWSVDGKALTYQVNHKGIDNIWLQPIDGGPPKQLTQFDSDRIFSFARSRAGRLAISRGFETRDVILLSNFR